MNQYNLVIWKDEINWIWIHCEKLYDKKLDNWGYKSIPIKTQIIKIVINLQVK